jgi:iron complex transport system ATP-binding protein
MIHLQNINFIREERSILSDIHLHIQQGENWVILGRNGCGKTTLLELMTGYEFPSSGKVDVLGYRYGTVDIREVRKKIGYIGQTLYEKLNASDPVWEVVATGEFAFLRFYEEIPELVREKALRKLERIGLLHLAYKPLGICSQGERKKIMLARALMVQPSILILDEPASGLDLYEREKFLVDVNELQQQEITVIYVTHHIEEIVPMFTHVALIEQGKIIASGRKHDVLNSELLSRAYQVPITLEWEADRPWIKVNTK